MNIFMSAQEVFEKLPEEEKANHMGVESRTSLNEIVDYIYEHFDEFKLIICKSEGASYENFIHNMVEIEVEETYQFIDPFAFAGQICSQHRKSGLPCDGQRSCFRVYLNLLNTIRKKKTLKNFLSEFQDFYIAGWSKILGL